MTAEIVGPVCVVATGMSGGGTYGCCTASTRCGCCCTGFGGGGGGGGALISSTILASIGFLITSTALRARPLTSA